MFFEVSVILILWTWEVSAVGLSGSLLKVLCNNTIYYCRALDVKQMSILQPKLGLKTSSMTLPVGLRKYPKNKST